MRILSLLLVVIIFSASAISQELPALKLNEKSSPYSIIKEGSASEKSYKETFQLKKRKTVNSYFGAGYSLIIFTNSKINELYPILDTRNGTFLTNISLFFGFAIAQAVSMEIEPGLLFTSSSKTIKTSLNAPHTTGSNDSIAYSSNVSMFAIPLAVNVRFFPFFKLKSYARLFFIGGGVGTIWIKEDYDNYYSDNPNLYTGGYYGFGGVSESTSQWAPLFRAMIGVTGTGGQFGFGGEVRYNFIPLKEEAHSPFRTRVAKDFNSVDINLRFYFSL